jgi:lipopolysaccharide export system permease protein
MLIYNYILKKCFLNTIFILLAFILIFAIFTLLGDAGNIGTADFTIQAIIFYLIILIPTFTYMLLPLAILIGVMLSLLSLVNYSEYSIIRTSGVSLKKIVSILIVFGTIFSIINFILGEFITPYTNHYAKTYKMQKLHQQFSTALSSGIWSKDGNNTYVSIKHILPNLSINDISAYYYDNQSQLKKIIHAKTGNFLKNSKYWLLNGVTIKYYTNNNSIIESNFSEYNWYTSIEPSYFNVLVITPEDMSIFELIKYIRHLNLNHQATNRYKIAFWTKLIYPLTCLSMAILSIIFIPNNRRNINLNSKLFIGIIVGISFFFTTKLINYMAILFAWNAILASIIPNFIILGFTYFFVKKQN